MSIEHRKVQAALMRTNRNVDFCMEDMDNTDVDRSRAIHEVRSHLSGLFALAVYVEEPTEPSGENWPDDGA